MQYGFGVPSGGPLASTQNLVALAQGGEAMGFSIVRVSDHIVMPRNIASRYPYSATGGFTSSTTNGYLEQLTALSFLAGQTSSIRLLTAVMVLPHRPPVLTAKILATIDVLSQGRLIVGCGVGWMREEFEALGAPSYDERGAVGNEYIRAFKELWTSDNPSFEGKYCRFYDLSFLPKPAQKPHPPIWIGGESPPALRRTALLGDAWYPISTNPRFPVATPEQYSESVSRIRRYAEDAGRDPSEIALAYSSSTYNDREAQLTPDGDRMSFTGTPQQIADDIKRFEDIGVAHLLFGFTDGTLEETLNGMERFATKVKPLAEG